MELLPSVKRVAFRTFFFFLFYTTLLWFSIFIYGIAYYLYIPAVAHVRPIHLQYAASCFMNPSKNPGTHCPFPSANISLVTRIQNDLLSRRQAYAIEILLEMPESETNRMQGMFMIKADMLSEHGEVIQTSSRPALLHYKSTLFTYLSTLIYIPGLLAGTVEEKQELVIPLYEQYEENGYQATHYIHIEVHARAIEIYRAQLRIHAQFTGLRYFMYYWPLFSATAGVCIIFFFMSFTAFVTWLRFVIMNGHVNDSIAMQGPRSRSETRLPLVNTSQSTKVKKKLPLQTQSVLLERKPVSLSISETSISSSLRIETHGDALPDSSTSGALKNDEDSEIEDGAWTDVQASISESPNLPSPSIRKRLL